MTFEIWAALAVVCITVYGLLKRWETRLVLLTSGFAMCLLALDPIAAFKQFDKSMTNASLIVVVCSAMGFARVMNLTGCDLHLANKWNASGEAPYEAAQPSGHCAPALLHDCDGRCIHCDFVFGRHVCGHRSDDLRAHDSRGFSAGNGRLYGDCFDAAVFLVARVFA